MSDDLAMTAVAAPPADAPAPAPRSATSAPRSDERTRLQSQSLRAYFGDVHALKGVTLSIPDR
ncbi:MAG: hypothetical protein M3125_03300, partial [Gemmatimonadota bacterium]|nr:hypothetical protein [Gemmatimonadota bacterium]